MKTYIKNRKIGAAIFFIFFSLLFFVLLIRFISIQYTGEAEGRVLSAHAAQLYLREQVLKSERGSIYDHNGEVIAENTDSFTLVAILDESLTTNEKYPRHVVDKRDTASKLANIIDLSEEEIYSILNKEKKQVEFGPAGRGLSHTVKQKIEDLRLPGIGFIKYPKRFYPNGIFSSHLIGYAQLIQEEDKPPYIKGQMGLEQSYDDLLTGVDGTMKYDGDKWDYILPDSETLVTEPQHGHDIYLTIDKKIQTFLEDAMTRVNEQYTPERIMAVVADPKTGKILAMGQRPTFHPETRIGIEESWHNEIIETTFEPGSTMKIFSLAAAINQGVFNANEKFPSGQYRVDSKSPPINDHNYGQGWGDITYLEGVQRSSNVAFAYLLEKMGTDAWLEYMNKFRFGEKTGISLPNEASGTILYRYPIEKVTSVYGQGTTVTAIQMVQAMTAIANDGVMMKPYVVDRIVNPNDGSVEQMKPEVVGQPISKETADEVIEILETAISGGDHVTGHWYEIDGYRVAGKTGTAQIADPKGGYLKGRENHIFSFLGLAPVEDPQLIMFVMVEQPKLNGENGAVPVSMIFNTVMKSSLQYLNIEPGDIPELNTVVIEDYIENNKNDVIQKLEEKGLKPIVIGTGENIIGQLPKPESTMIEGEKVFLKTDGSLLYPDMTDWSKREVLSFADLVGIHVEVIGQGYVFKQSHSFNSTIQQGDQITVHFETPQEKIHRLSNTEKVDEPIN